MKKITFLSLFLVSGIAGLAQENKVEKDTTSTGINKYTIELSTGQSKGVNPYTDGYFSSADNKVLGTIVINSYNLGVRYMINPVFGVKGDLGYVDLKNNPSTTSIPFEMKVYSFGLQGVINANRLLGLEKSFGRFGMLLHGGFQLSQMTPNTANEMNPLNPADVVRYHNAGLKEYNVGLIYGFSPQFRLFNKVALIGDVSVVNSYRQHFAWDGAYSDSKNNLSGQLVSMSLGFTYSLGKDKMHGDWAVVKDKYIKEIEKLQNQVKNIETSMGDLDKDGVPDYLDLENNSLAGAAVDTKGRTVDLNKNGVPDDLEKYIEQNQKDFSKIHTANTVSQLVNDGYISVFFETGKVDPTDISSPGIDFIRTYLKNNPKSSIEILGHADEVGRSESNVSLAKARAESVKAILVKAGIDESRLIVVSKGEDTSVQADSEGARKLVRKVTFKIK
jgi:OOP family OmpA-OmpF porin